jgi:predicted outer membrane repeat protein
MMNTPARILSSSLTFQKAALAYIRSALRLAAVLVWVATLFAPAVAHAQIYVDANVSGGAGDGSSWADAYTDLQDALDVATGSDQIWIAEGTYTPTARLDASDPRTATFLVTGVQDGLEIYGGFENGDAFADRNSEDHPVILSGDLIGNDGPDTDGDGIPDSGRGENSYHVLVFDGGDSFGPSVDSDVTTATVLANVTVTGGNANLEFLGGGSTGFDRGGGLYCDGGYGGNCSPTIVRVIFTANTAADFGGAIFNNGSAGRSSPRIINSTFTSNRADRGGAIHNQASNGGTDNAGIGSPQIIGSIFTGNSATDRGGAVHNYAGFSSPLGNVIPQITNSRFANNRAFSGEGGAVYHGGGDMTSALVVVNSTFAENVADKRGGAIYSSSALGATDDSQIIGNTFTGNQAEDGGAIYIFGSSTGTNSQQITSSPQIIGSTFSGNTASNDGGAIYFSNYFDFDSATGPQITNSILWGNQSGTGPFPGGSGDQIYNSESTIALAHILIEDGLAGIVSSGSSSVTDGGNNLNANPLFVNATDPDGADDIPATADDGLRLSAGSPALDAGDNAGLPSDTSDLDGDGDTTEPIPFDITGSDRVRDNNPDTPPTVDLGAYEAPADVVIPVELVDFTATATGARDVMLTWQTASETNNAGFHVEQRTPDRDNPRNDAWREVAFVAGAGTTTEAQTYHYRMDDVDYGQHAFRLRQVDLDGTATLSPAVSITVGLAETHAMAAYPNPVDARQSVTIALTTRTVQAVTVVVYDVLGRQVATLFDGEVAASRTERLRLPSYSLSSGVYFVRAVGERFTATERITVAR